MDNVTLLKKLIAEDRIDVVVEILCLIFKTKIDVYNEVILCKSRLTSLRKELLTTDTDQILRQKNLINKALLLIIDANYINCIASSVPKIEAYNIEIAVFEQALWNFVEIMNGKNDYEYFLSKYPGSIFSSFAQRAIQDIDKNYLESTVIVQLTTSTPHRFNIAQIDSFGHLVDIISNLLDAYVQNDKYGQGWILELGHDTHYILKHGRMIVDDYHSKRVKDIRSLHEMSINDNTTLYVKRLKGNTMIDDVIYSDVVVTYQKSVCNFMLNAEDIPDELIRSAQQKLREIENKTIKVCHLERTNSKPKNNEEKNKAAPVSFKDNRSVLPTDEIVFYVVFLILCLFFPVLLYLFINALQREDVRIWDVFSIFLMICIQLFSTITMWYFKRKIR